MNKVRIPLPLSYLSIDVQLFKSTTRNHRQPTTAVTMARHRERAVDLPVPRSQEPDPASRHTANGPKASHTGSSILVSRPVSMQHAYGRLLWHAQVPHHLMRTNGCCQPARMRLPVYTILVVLLNCRGACGWLHQRFCCLLPRMLCSFQRAFLVMCLLPLTSSLRGVRSDVTEIIRTARYCLSAIPLTGIIRTAGYCLSACQPVIGTMARESDHNAKRSPTCTRPVASPKNTPMSRKHGGIVAWAVVAAKRFCSAKASINTCYISKV
jgi:hypothetical protein